MMGDKPADVEAINEVLAKWFNKGKESVPWPATKELVHELEKDAQQICSTLTVKLPENPYKRSKEMSDKWKRAGWNIAIQAIKDLNKGVRLE